MSMTLRHTIAELLHLAVMRDAKKVTVSTTANDYGGTELTITDDGDPPMFEEMRNSPAWDRIQANIKTFADVESRTGDPANPGWKSIFAPGWRTAEGKRHDGEPGPCEPGERGLRISVTLSDSRASTREGAYRAARTLPIPTEIDGDRTRRERFLKPNVFTHEWDGARIQVHASRSRFSFDRDNACFKGLILELDMPTTEIGGMHLSTTVDLSKVDPGKIERAAERCTQLAKTPWSRALGLEAERAIYLAVADDAFGFGPKLAMSTDTLRKANRRGVKLEPHGGNLTPWTAKPGRSAVNGDPELDTCKPVFVPEGTDALIIDLKADPDQGEVERRAREVTLERALEGNGLLDRAYEPNPTVEGQRWYDRLTRIRDFRVAATNADGEEAYITGPRGDNPGTVLEAPAGRPRLKLIPRTHGGPPAGPPLEDTGGAPEDGPAGMLDHPPLATDLALTAEPDIPESFHVFVAPDTELTTAELRDLITRAYFTPYSDSEADHDGERDRFRTEAEHHAARILEGDTDADLRQILRFVHNELPWRLDSRLDDDTEVRWSRRGKRMTAEITNHATGETATRTIHGIDELDQ